MRHLPNSSCKPRTPARLALLTRWLVIASFVTGTIGIPFPAGKSVASGHAESCAINPGQPCRCSLASRKLGTCCCAKGLVASKVHCHTSKLAKRSCCEKRESTVAATKTPTSQKPADKNSPKLLSLSSCPCGSSSSTTLWICGEPRLFAVSSPTNLERNAAEHPLPVDEIRQSPHRRPEVPPPRSDAHSV